MSNPEPTMPATWTLRDDLELFGIHIPKRIPLDRWVAGLRDNPCQNTLALVGLSAILFCQLEKGRNPKVNDIYDALVYCSTCFSVGYGDIFARTPLGKLIGTILMTVGPAMTNKFLDGPATEPRDAVQEEILATLKQILRRLEEQGVSQ